MTDAELRDAAVAELRQTTRGLKGYTPAPSSHWGQALNFLAQIGQAAPPPPPPPPPPAAYLTLADLTAVFRPQWVQPAAFGGGFTGIPDGFRFVVGPGDVPTWDAQTKAILAVGPKLMLPEGVAEAWHFKLALPSAGNPSGFVKAWQAGVLFEAGHTDAPNSQSGHHLAIDATSFAKPRFRIAVHKPPFGNAYDFVNPPFDIALDHEYDVRVAVGWSTGAAGFLNVDIDGTRYVARTGPTIAAGEHPKYQFGFYSRIGPTNEARFALVQHVAA